MAEERNQSFVDLIRNRLRGMFFGAEDQRKKTTEHIPIRIGPFMQGADGASDWYQDALAIPTGRMDKYNKYAYLDENLAEATCVLNIYADTVVAGSIGGEECYWVMIDEETPDKDRYEKLIDDTEQRTGIKDYIWDISRDLCKFGDEFEEVVVEEYKEGYGVAKLKKLPIKQCFADVDQRGIFRDQDFPYYQRPDNYSEKIKFDWWRIIHFKMGRDTYGFNRSAFANAALRIGRQLIWIDDSLVLARMSRAWMRYVYMIDTEGLSPEQALDYVDRYMQRIKRREVIDKVTGRVSEIDAPMLPDEDIGLPVSANGKTSVQTLSGDMNLGNIRDLYYLQNKFFAATSVPKAYAAIEEGVNARATITQLDVQFARQVRRRQSALKPGLKKFYELVFTLAGIDSNSFKWSIEFPELATEDEMIKWTIENAKAAMAKAYHIDMKLLNSDWVYKEILKFDEEEIDMYAELVSEQPEQPAEYDAEGNLIEPGMRSGNSASDQLMQLSPNAVEAIQHDPYVRMLLDDVNDMIEWKRARKTARTGMKPVGAKSTRKR